MSSFYAELAVDGQTPYPLHQCQVEFTQATDQRGRVTAKVRHGLLHLTLDVPSDDQLLDWASAAYKPLSGHITFFEDDWKTARETVSFAAGQCVSYQESFVAGDGETGAYVCQLLITSAGFTLVPGGAPQAFVAPAAGEPSASPTTVTSAMEWMADPPANAWEGKKQSGKAYLGSPPLKRSPLQQLQAQAYKQLGTNVTVLKEGDEMLTMMRSMRRRAAFQASTNTVFLQPQATLYEVSHELKHAQQCAELGVDAYAQQTTLEKETYVYEQLMQNKAALTPAEISHATAYLASERSKVGLSSLVK